MLHQQALRSLFSPEVFILLFAVGLFDFSTPALLAAVVVYSILLCVELAAYFTGEGVVIYRSFSVLQKIAVLTTPLLLWFGLIFFGATAAGVELYIPVNWSDVFSYATLASVFVAALGVLKFTNLTSKHRAWCQLSATYRTLFGCVVAWVLLFSSITIVEKVVVLFGSLSLFQLLFTAKYYKNI